MDGDERVSLEASAMIVEAELMFSSISAAVIESGGEECVEKLSV
jgi:hypothetical protein